MANPRIHATPDGIDRALRTMVLGTVYAGAVFFAIAFSPRMGFVTPQAPTVASLPAAAALR